MQPVIIDTPYTVAWKGYWNARRELETFMQERGSELREVLESFDFGRFERKLFNDGCNGDPQLLEIARALVYNKMSRSAGNKTRDIHVVENASFCGRTFHPTSKRRYVCGELDFEPECGTLLCNQHHYMLVKGTVASGYTLEARNQLWRNASGGISDYNEFEMLVKFTRPFATPTVPVKFSEGSLLDALFVAPIFERPSRNTYKGLTWTFRSTDGREINIALEGETIGRKDFVLAYSSISTRILQCGGAVASTGDTRLSLLPPYIIDDTQRA